jgi:hypothetical protein
MTKRLLEEVGSFENCKDDVLGLLLNGLDVLCFFTMRRVSKKIYTLALLSKKKPLLCFLSKCRPYGSTGWFHSCRPNTSFCSSEKLRIVTHKSRNFLDNRLDRSEFAIIGEGKSVSIFLRNPICPNWGSSHTRFIDHFTFDDKGRVFYLYEKECYKTNGLIKCRLEWSI